VPLEAQWAAGTAGDGWSVMWEHWDADAVAAQLDDAVAYGCNVVRTMGSVLGIHLGNYTRAAYLALWDELEAMATARGLYLYPTLNPGGAERTPMSAAFLTAEARAWAAHVNAYRRCVAIDVIQEDHVWGASAAGQALLGELREVTDLPLTYSIIGGAPGQPHTAENQAARDLLRGKVDLLDLHWYFDTPAANVLEVHVWPDETVPLVIGEYGAPLSLGAATQEAQVDAIVAAVSHVGASGRRPAGAFAWCARDFVSTPTSNQWGLKSGDGSSTRQYLVDALEAVPTS
jgi:hypothetical protein